MRWVVFVLCVAFAADAYAADPRIEQADRLIRDQLRYKAGIDLLERTIDESDLTDEDRVEAYRLLGVAYVAREKPQSAEAAFEALLAIDPSYTLDVRLSPKIRSVFERAQAKVAPRLIDVTAIPEGRRVVVSARVEDPRGVLVGIDLYARAGADAFERQAMTRREDRAAAVVEVPDLTELRLDYYLVGRGARDTLVTVADATAPLSVVVARTAAPAITAPPPEPDDPIYTRWWFWTAAAVVVVGAVVGGVAIATSGSNPPEGTLPPVEL